MCCFCVGLWRVPFAEGGKQGGILTSKDRHAHFCTGRPTFAYLRPIRPTFSINHPNIRFLEHSTHRSGSSAAQPQASNTAQWRYQRLRSNRLRISSRSSITTLRPRSVVKLTAAPCTAKTLSPLSKYGASLPCRIIPGRGLVFASRISSLSPKDAEETPDPRVRCALKSPSHVTRWQQSWLTCVSYT